MLLYLDKKRTDSKVGGAIFPMRPVRITTFFFTLGLLELRDQLLIKYVVLGN